MRRPASELTSINLVCEVRARFSAKVADQCAVVPLISLRKMQEGIHKEGLCNFKSFTPASLTE